MVLVRAVSSEWSWSEWSWSEWSWSEWSWPEWSWPEWPSSKVGWGGRSRAWRKSPGLVGTPSAVSATRVPSDLPLAGRRRPRHLRPRPRPAPIPIPCAVCAASSRSTADRAHRPPGEGGGDEREIELITLFVGPQAVLQMDLLDGHGHRPMIMAGPRGLRTRERSAPADGLAQGHGPSVVLGGYMPRPSSSSRCRRGLATKTAVQLLEPVAP